MGQRYRKMEDQKWGPGLACNLDFVKWKGLEPKVEKIFKILQIGRGGKQIFLTQTYHRLGSRGWPLGDFLEKNSYFDTIWNIFCLFLEPLEIAKFLRFESHLKKSNW